LRIRVLGGLEIADATGAAVRLSTAKTGLVLAALVLAGPRPIRREALIAALWPDRGETQGRGSLRQALVQLRRAFPDGEALHIAGEGDTVALAGPADAVDAWAFERLAALPGMEDREAAARLYRGDVLAGTALPEPLDRHFEPQQRTFRLRALALAESLSRDAAGDAAAACAALAERLLAADPAAEEAHRALIRLHRRAGHANAAHRQLALCREALRRELGVEPEAETLALMAEAAPEQRPDPAPTPAEPPASRRDQPSVVIMPFDNLSGPADEAFADGVVEEITATLSRVRDFFVIARQSAFAFKDRFVDVREVGRALGVAYVVEGTVRRAGERVRISVQLVDAESRAQLWSDRYEGTTTDIFAFQDDIAARVAGAIHPRLLGAEIAAAIRKPPESLQAHELVLKAYPRLWSAVEEENRAALALLREAAAIDPDYGRAHALTAWCHAQEVAYLWSADPEADRAAARAAADRAVDRVQDDPMGLTALGAAFSMALGDLDRATLHTERALALDPNHVWAWARSGWIAVYRDQPAHAVACFERALALSPLDPLEFNFRVGIASAVGMQGDYAEAARIVRAVLDKHPRVAWVYRQYAAFLALSGDVEGARRAIRKLLAVHPGTTVARMATGHPGRHTPRFYATMLKGWRLAGLPEG